MIDANWTMTSFGDVRRLLEQPKATFLKKVGDTDRSLLPLCEERADIQLITAPRIKGAITIEFPSRPSVGVASP